MLTTVNLSNADEYFSQKNNEIRPLEACAATALIEALFLSNVDFDYPKNMQPEDYLTQMMETKMMHRKLTKEHPALAQAGYRPAEVHDLLVYAVNEILVQRRVLQFSVTIPLEMIIYDLAVRGRPVVVSGQFTSYGHVVVVVGFTSRQKNIRSVKSPYDVKIGHVREVIVDDPYGNYHTKYQDPRGFNVRFTVQEFARITKQLGSYQNKWAHRIIV